ncbi:MAG TPA: hypothetical protein VKK31_00660 [Thermoanaerobaculia bacterium]|nr:hypothetical protein [Thermoanaerobaculia bacterium]
MADYFWDMGIDWKAVQPLNGLSYLLTGLATIQGAPAVPVLNQGDTITFRIFDVTHDTLTPHVAAIESFVINTAAAVQDQTAGVPFSTLQPLFLNTPDVAIPLNTAFPHPLRSWTSQAIPGPVKVIVPEGRFLLGFQTQALGEDTTSRTFAHDPEMIIGEHG